MCSVSAYEGAELVGHWATLMDNQADASAIAYYATPDFMIKFGDLELVGLPGLTDHQHLKEAFFGERHLYYDFQVESDGPPLIMTTQMIWDALRRTSSGATEHLIADLRHRWTFVRESGTRRPLMQRHELLEMNYRTGFGPSESDPTDLHLDPARVGFGNHDGA